MTHRIRYAIVDFKDHIIAAVADGCGWGEPAKEAGFSFLSHLIHLLLSDSFSFFP
jgi:hypothetical protein